MDNLQRIYERFDDINDFAGHKPQKAYGREHLKKFEELGLDDITFLYHSYNRMGRFL